MPQPNVRKGATELTPEVFLATFPAAVAALADPQAPLPGERRG